MKKEIELSGFELIEESLALLRSQGLYLLPYYGIGTIPFVLCFLFFWSDMAQDAFAEGRLFSYALGLSLLYSWMKYWQTMFVRGLRYRIMSQEEPATTWGQRFWVFLFQGTIQPLKWLALPLSKLLVYPFGYVHAFFETLSVTGDGEERSVPKTVQKTWGLSLLFPYQNHLLIWMISPWMLIFGFGLLGLLFSGLPYFYPEVKEMPFEYLEKFWLVFLVMMIPFSPVGILIFANIGLILYGLPYLGQSLLGIESSYTYGTFKCTDPHFLVICLSLTFLIMDPILKTTYAFRDFYGRSLTTGEDLMLKYKKGERIRRGVRCAILFFGFLTATSIYAEEKTVGKERSLTRAEQELGEVIESVSKDREYTWRQERRAIKKEEGEELSFIEKIGQFIKEGIVVVFDWVMEWVLSIGGEKEGFENGDETNIDRSFVTRFFMWGGVIVLGLGIIAGMIYYFRKSEELTNSGVIAPSVIPDLESHQVIATDLEKGEWERLANTLMKSEEWRLASRAWYLGGLSILHHEGWIRVRRGKSNADYLRESEEHFHVRPEIYRGFREATEVFERLWYGFLVVQKEEALRLQKWVQGIKKGGG